MPSRPVLIGRGLVPTTYKTTHTTRTTVCTVRDTTRTQRTHTQLTTEPVRVHYAVPNQQTHEGEFVLKELRRP